MKTYFDKDKLIYAELSNNTSTGYVLRMFFGEFGWQAIHEETHDNFWDVVEILGMGTKDDQQT